MPEIESGKVSEIPILTIVEFNILDRVYRKITSNSYNDKNIGGITEYFSPIGKTQCLSEKPIEESSNTIVDTVEYAGNKEENQGKEYFIEKELLTIEEQLEHAFEYIQTFNELNDKNMTVTIPTVEDFKSICSSEEEHIPKTIDHGYTDKTRQPLKSKEILQNEKGEICLGYYDMKKKEAVVTEPVPGETNVAVRLKWEQL